MSKWKPSRPNGGNMFYKHWKKFALALTALFWAGCDDSASSSEVVLYGCPDDICAPAPESSSDANDAQSGSSDPSTVFCTPMDSSVSYFPNDYSADKAKFWKEEAAKHDAQQRLTPSRPPWQKRPCVLNTCAWNSSVSWRFTGSQRLYKMP